MKIIILNGPAGVGKDTLGVLLAALYKRHEMFSARKSFKSGIFSAVKGMMTEDAYKQLLKDAADRVQKEAPKAYLNNLTPRQFLIKVSEEWIKPVFGDAHFGELAVDSVGQEVDIGTHVCIFTDGGFDAEIAPLVREFGDDVKVVQLHREGYTFEGDSRGYISYPYATIPLTDGCAEKDALTIFKLLEGAE